MEDPSTFVSTGFQKPKFGEKLLLNDGGRCKRVGSLRIPINDKINKLHFKRKNLAKPTSAQRNKDKQNGVNKFKFHNSTPDIHKNRQNSSTRKPIIIKSDELLAGKKKVSKDKPETVNFCEQTLSSIANLTDDNFSPPTNDNEIALKTNYFNNEFFSFADDINLTTTIDQSFDSQIEIFLENINNGTITQPINTELSIPKSDINPDDLLNDLSDVCDKFELSVKSNGLDFIQVSNEKFEIPLKTSDKTDVFINVKAQEEPLEIEPKRFENIKTKRINLEDKTTNSLGKNEDLTPAIVSNDETLLTANQMVVYLCPVEGCGCLLDSVEAGAYHLTAQHGLEVVTEAPDADAKAPALQVDHDGDNSGEDTGQVADFIRRMNERKKGQFSCSECGAIFKKEKRLEAHFRYHSDSRPFKCIQPQCDWAFTSAYKLARHLETHWGHKKYACDEEGCNKQFTTLYNLNYHKKLHERPSLFPCMAPDCLQTFSTKKKMEQHLKDHKEVEAPYKCSVESCGKPFYSYNILVSHLRIHEHTQEDLTCPFANCKKRFERMCRLRLHIRGHTGERPYVCDVPGCGWTFVSASKLTRHRKKHTGERKYPCPQCSKCFMRPEHLRGHLVIHSGAKPFACPHDGCPAAFTARSTLYVHLKKHTGSISGTKVAHPCPEASCARHFSCKSSLQEHLTKEHPNTDDVVVEEYLTLIYSPKSPPIPAELSNKVVQENHSGSARTDFCSSHKQSPKLSESAEAAANVTLPSTDVVLASSAMIGTNFLQDDYGDFGTLSDLPFTINLQDLCT